MSSRPKQVIAKKGAAVADPLARPDDPKNRQETGRKIHDLLPLLVVESHKKENKVNNNHISALRTKHAEIEQKLEREENRPFPDTQLIHTLKKKKLTIKDALTFERQPA
jgi:hypothetical protein